MWQVTGAALLLLVISVLVIRRARQFPFLVTGWLWYFGTLVPVIGLVQVGKQSVADRYTYVPLIGLFIMIAWGVAHLLGRWSHRKVMLSTFASILLVALAVCAWWQVRYWRNGIVLFKHSLDVTTNNHVAHDSLGVALARQGKLKEAVAHFSGALRIRPNYAEAHNNLGVAFVLQGRLDQATTHFLQALHIDPTYSTAHKGMGMALTRAGRLNEAAQHYLQGLESKPDDPVAHNDLGTVLARLGRLEEAIPHFSEALRIMPNNAQVRDNLKRALRLSGKSEAASNTLVRPDSR
jgi:Flp pilus assembly protein TadD